MLRRMSRRRVSLELGRKISSQAQGRLSSAGYSLTSQCIRLSSAGHTLTSQCIRWNSTGHNSLISRRSDSANAANSLISQRSHSARSDELSGTTFIAKDNIASVGEPTTCGSLMLADYTSPFEATVLTLLQNAGSALVGKSNMDEFGMGSSTTHSHFGATLNPLFTENEHIAGGSSGGSAAAVAASLASFALGTDTGGSVRLPASYCGVVGFKPSYGRISRWGVVAYAQSLDTVGIFSKNVDLIERVFQVVDKYDEKDITCLPDEVRTQIKQYRESNNKQHRLTIGIPVEFSLEDIDNETRSLWSSLLKTLMEDGHRIQVISVPSIKKSLSAYYTLVTAEAASNLSRYDGLRYGFSSDALQETSHKTLTENRSQAFGAEVQRRVLLGNYTLSSESGNHYLKATERRRTLVEEFNAAFKFPNFLVGGSVPSGGCDVIISPTAIDAAPPMQDYQRQTEKNFLSGYINDILTVPASLAGLPSISIPLKDPKRGIQLTAQYGDDEQVISAAKIIEQTIADMAEN